MMRIYSFATFLAAPFAIALGIILYMAFTRDDYYDLLNWILPPFFILAIIWVMTPQINWWWWKRNPPPLDQPILKWLQQFSPFYNSLSEVSKKNFERRLVLFIKAKDFATMGEERGELPEDLKAIIAHNAIQLTFGRKDFLFDKYERVAAYKHPFPTPGKQYLHTVETETEDGTLIFALEYLIPGMLRKGEFYNIGLHGFIDAFLDINKSISFPNIDHVTWEQLEQVSGFSSEYLLNLTGLKEINKLTVLINHYVTFNDKLRKQLPDEANQLEEIFRLYPAAS